METALAAFWETALPGLPLKSSKYVEQGMALPYAAYMAIDEDITHTQDGPCNLRKVTVQIAVYAATKLQAVAQSGAVAAVASEFRGVFAGITVQATFNRGTHDQPIKPPPGAEMPAAACRVATWTVCYNA